MGDYDNTQVDGPATTAYGAYKSHFSNRVAQTDLVLTESLRNLHPNKHITCVMIQSANFMEFADAGKATARLIRDGDEFLATRGYAAPVGRRHQSEGRLTESVRFGLFDYAYEGDKFSLYVMSWRETGTALNILQYLLCDREGVSADGHHPAADKLLKAVGRYSSELHEQIYVFDGGNWSKNHALWEAVQSASWDDVILDPAMKDTLIKDVNNFFDSRSVYVEHGVPWKRGIILHGTPGCGKTISIKALMNDLDKTRDVASLYVKSIKAGSNLEHSIGKIFHQARLMAPCILIIEDLDSLVVDEVRSYFLNELDGLEDNNGMLIIGSTNHLERLDPGISKRPSRFDRKYHYKLPGERERILYCQYWRHKLSKSGKIEFPEEICPVVAQLTDGFSFAYMKELFVQTLLSIVGGHADADVDEDDGYVTVTDVVADRSKVVDDSAKLAIGNETTESTQEDTEVKEQKAKPQMPDVEIPETLRSLSLMRILHKQAKALWREMDNTRDEIHSRAKMSTAGGARAQTKADMLRRKMLRVG